MTSDLNIFYVYLHRRNDTNEVFYVGKGCNERASSKSGRNSWWTAVVNKHGYSVEYVEKYLSEEDAFELEIELIKFYKECGHLLVNMTEGGDGTSGYTFSKETKLKMREANIKEKTPVICSNGLVFETLGAAAEWVRENTKYKKAKRSNIFRCCRGKTNHCYGFRWRYYENGEPSTMYHAEPINAPFQKKMHLIGCSNGMQFNNMTDAANWLKENGWHKANRSSISKCCLNIQKRAYGYEWFYID